MIVSLWWQVAAIVAPFQQDLKAVLTYWQGPGNSRLEPTEVGGTRLAHVRCKVPRYRPPSILRLRCSCAMGPYG